MHGAPIRHHLASGSQVRVPGRYHRVQHALEEKEVSHPLGHDHVKLVLQLDVLQPAFGHLNDVAEVITPKREGGRGGGGVLW